MERLKAFLIFFLTPFDWKREVPQYLLLSCNCSFYTFNRYVPSDSIFLLHTVSSLVKFFWIWMCYWDCARVKGRRTNPKVSLTGISELESLCLWWFLSFLINCSILWAPSLLKILRWWIYWMLNWSCSFPWQCFPTWMVFYQRLKQSLSVCRLLALQHQVAPGWELSAREHRCCSASATQITGVWVFPHIQPC